MQLPADLQTALEKLAQLHGGGDAGKMAQAVSARYRDRHRDGGEVMVGSDVQAVAYAVTRMPATWAALRASMEHLSEVMPGFHPTSLLDIGAGTAAAAWAAAAVWPELEKCILLERAGAMMRIGRELSADAAHPAVQDAEWVDADLRTGLQGKTADLVTAAYVLNETGESGLLQAVDLFWQASGSVLLLVEPGTPDGWLRILRARDHLLARGAHVLAPCPHARKCPVNAPDWCHFVERVNRLRTHRQMKDAELSYEDEKFSWLAVAKDRAVDHLKGFSARIRRHPDIHSGFVRLSLCSKEGLREETVSRSRRDAWKAVRDAANGDIWPFDTEKKP